jgi:hypothetical protein
MMKKMILGCIMMSSLTSLYSYTDLIKIDLEQFLSSQTDDDIEKTEFRGYYSKFLRKQTRHSRLRKGHRLRKLRRKALASIEIKNPKLYEQFKQYLIDLDELDSCRDLRLFLTRYALFEEYQSKKIISNKGFFGKARSYASRVNNKMKNLYSRATS